MPTFATVATTAAIVAATLAVPTAANAAKAPPPAASLSATPQSVTYSGPGEAVTFTGCGYRVSTATAIVVTGPAATSTFGASTNSVGCLSLVDAGMVTGAGTYRAQAFQSDSRGRWVLAASASFSVS